MDAIYRQCFPKITNVAQKKTSEADPKYNCIAHAFKKNRGIWWPDAKGYWPIPFDNMTTLQAFEAWFATDGWEQTQSAALEPDYEKIALYMLNGVPTHAARLLPNGLWTSKLGWRTNYCIDLSHDLADLSGPLYGSVTRFYRKKITTTSSASPPPSEQSQPAAS